VTLGDADIRKSPMKMIYRKLPKTASLPVTCHWPSLVGSSFWDSWLSGRLGISLAYIGSMNQILAGGNALKSLRLTRSRNVLSVLFSVYLITLSALASTLGGMLRPICFGGFQI
jgi:hypothetical protein